MRRIFRSSLFALLLSASGLLTSAAVAEGYLDMVEDMPLMDGLVETGEGGVAFDKPAGRIIRSTATGDLAPSDIRSFYENALPPLGWKLTGSDVSGNALTFERDGERLEIEVAPLSGQQTEVRFSIEPE